MDNLEKLQKRVNELVEQFEKQHQANEVVEQENNKLKEQIRTMESRIKTLLEENRHLERGLREKNEAALKRISRLVDKIDQFQTEMKIS